MANYKDIHGINIETVSSNPDNPANGQGWYNSTDQKLRGNAQTTVGAWASGGNMNTARSLLMGSGIDTSSLAYGGFTSPPATQRAETESYNGTSWTEVADLNTARNNGGSAGSSNTNALLVGGAPSAVTEQWDGSSWTEIADLNSPRLALGAGGTSTAALAFGGYDTAVRAYTESWDGSSWTEVGDLNTARISGASSGIYTSALFKCGTLDPPVLANCESWNGTSWTEVGDLNTAREQFRGAGANNTLAVVFGGNPGSVDETETWNGSSWTETTDLSTGRSNLAGSGTGSSALAFGGQSNPSTRLTSTENFTAAGADSTREFDLS